MKKSKYTDLTEQISALAHGETNAVGLMANAAAAIHDAMGFWWTGFYTASGDMLHLGPFQGPVACMSIRKGRGVCGTAFAERRTVIVPNVHEFPGHIACSSLSNSEIVVPMLASNGEVLAVLDIDSREFNTFDTTDQEHLERICSLLAPVLEEAMGR